MAAVTLAGTGFALGTVLSVYPAEQRVENTVTGSPSTTGTVVAPGVVTFSGLTEGRRYVAAAAGRFVDFRVDEAIDASITAAAPGKIRREKLEQLVTSAGVGSIDSRLDALEASQALEASVVWDPGSIAAGGYAITSLSVPGAELGDFVQASLGVSGLIGLILGAAVTGADAVAVTLANHTVVAIDLASSTLRVRVIPAST